MFSHTKDTFSAVFTSQFQSSSSSFVHSEKKNTYQSLCFLLRPITLYDRTLIGLDLLDRQISIYILIAKAKNQLDFN